MRQVGTGSLCLCLTLLLAASTTVCTASQSSQGHSILESSEHVSTLDLMHQLLDSLGEGRQLAPRLKLHRSLLQDTDPACEWHASETPGVTGCYPSPEFLRPVLFRDFKLAFSEFGSCFVNTSPGVFNTTSGTLDVSSAECTADAAQWCETYVFEPSLANPGPVPTCASAASRVTDITLERFRDLIVAYNKCPGPWSYIGWNSTEVCRQTWADWVGVIGCRSCELDVPLLPELDEICNVGAVDVCTTTAAEQAARVAGCHLEPSCVQPLNTTIDPRAPIVAVPVNATAVPPTDAVGPVPVDDGSDGTSASIIIGAVCAGFFAMVVIAVVSGCCYCRTKNKHAAKKAEIMRSTQDIADAHGLVTVRTSKAGSVNGATPTTMARSHNEGSRTSTVASKKVAAPFLGSSLASSPVAATTKRSNSGRLPPTAGPSHLSESPRAIQMTSPLQAATSAVLPEPANLTPIPGSVTPPRPVTAEQGSNILPPIQGLHVYEDLVASESSTAMPTPRGTRSLPFRPVGHARKKLIAGVHQALDAVRDSPEHPGQFDQFTLEGNEPRHTGSNSVVALAHDSNGAGVAVKYFAESEAFYRELAMHEVTKSRSRPFVLEFKENMDALPGKKGRLPSYVVMARGISLREWTRTQPPDVTVYWLLHDVCTQLAALHAGGFVHRDVRPANVMWLPGAGAWKLIDFHTTGHEGEALGQTTGIKFAAPEAVQNNFRRESTLKADPAVDVWAVGVMAFELISGASFFPAGSSSEDQKALLIGEKPFSVDHDSAAWASLGALENIVRRMVRMEPRLRPPVRDLADMLHDVTLASKARVEGSYL